MIVGFFNLFSQELKLKHFTFLHTWLFAFYSPGFYFSFLEVRYSVGQGSPIAQNCCIASCEEKLISLFRRTSWKKMWWWSLFCVGIFRHRSREGQGFRLKVASGWILEVAYFVAYDTYFVLISCSLSLCFLSLSMRTRSLSLSLSLCWLVAEIDFRWSSLTQNSSFQHAVLWNPWEFSAN